MPNQCKKDPLGGWHLANVFFLFAPLFSYTAIRAQLTTSTVNTPTQLVEDILIGDGVAVSNIRYTGAANAIGSFDGTATNLGIDKGIILTTGTVLNESGGGLLGGGPRGPHGPNTSASAGFDNGRGGYAALSNLAGTSTFNAAILEFDFVPQADSVKFSYVFASEEYPEFVDAGFNDVFAFYISGPGFASPYNMATIPSGGVVSIDNINAMSNNAYFVNNGTGNTYPSYSSEFYIQYDGFTVVMDATAKVQCGEKYHLIIAIADAGDGAYDSGIFLEANSFDSYAPVEMKAELALDGFEDGVTMAEGCETATITVSRNATLAIKAETIPVIIRGTATEGVDYGTVPDAVQFSAGQAQATFSFDIYADELTEGRESLIIELDQPDPCNNLANISLELTIEDIQPLQVVVDDVSSYCSGDEAILRALPTGGLPAYTYLWNTGDTNDSVAVYPTATATYSVTVNDICIGTPVTASGTVLVPVYPPLVLSTSPDTSVLCPNTPQTLFAQATGGEGTYTYRWRDGGNEVSNFERADISPMVTTTYEAVVTDGCGVEAQGEVNVTVQASVLQLEMSPRQLICPGDSTDIWVIATEGLGDYTYLWTPTGSTDSQVNVRPPHTTTYEVSVEDACRTYSIEDTTVVEVVRPVSDFNVLSSYPMEKLLTTFQNTTQGGVEWYWDFGNDDSSTKHSPGTVYDAEGQYDVTLIAYNEIGCSDTVTKPVYIHPEYYFYAPNAFTPDGDKYNDFYRVATIGVTEFEFSIFNRWGELIYQTNNPYFRWNGTYQDRPIMDNVMVYKARTKDTAGNVHNYTGIITLLR